MRWRPHVPLRHVAALGCALVALCLPSQGALINSTDIATLMKLKNMYRNRPNMAADLATWLPQNDCLKWKLILCDGDRVSGVYFQGTKLGGPFPYVVTKLAKLRHWYGTDNDFTGAFPEGFSALSRLEVLRLSGNRLSGKLPASFSGLKRLYKFYVKDNKFLTGTIPPSWSAINLREAYFDNNAFSGPLPTVVCNWSILEKLRIGNNKWSGGIPTCLFKLTKLINLYLDNAGLTGRIPPGIGNLPNLELVFMNVNFLTGPIPPSVGNLKKLKTLFLSGNRITGPLPRTMGKLTGLKEWVMEFNLINGKIPTEMGLMTSLERILLDNNKLTGPIPDSMSNLKQLTILLLEGNFLHGGIPPGIPRALVNLRQFNVESNWLSGFLPRGWASPYLNQINYRSNYFTGSPDSIDIKGKLLCPPREINSWIHSSTGFNCFTRNASCGANYNERQLRRAYCTNFCVANGPKGACNGKGTCTYVVRRNKRRAMCKCNKGSRISRNGMSCK